MPGLIPMFTMANVARRITDFKDKRIQDGIMTLANVGEDFVDRARSTQTYTDRTSNLRGSIGYAILLDGEVQMENLEGATEGQEAAKGLIQELAEKFDDGLVLVGFAGMSYAAAVEALGYDVITGSVPGAEKLLGELKKELGL